jgi:hypothetical protein
MFIWKLLTISLCSIMCRVSCRGSNWKKKPNVSVWAYKIGVILDEPKLSLPYCYWCKSAIRNFYQ